MALLWDFAREIASGSPGNTTSYYDEACQAFYTLGTYIMTQVGLLNEGQWQNVEYGDPIAISNPGYENLDIEHHHNGAVYGTAQHDSDVVFFIYNYMLDVSDLLSDGSWELQPDNPIKAGSVSLMNVNNDLFQDSINSIFMPGNKVTLRLKAGDSSYYDLAVFFIESSPFAMPASEFQFSGRNKIGFYFSAQNFDENTSFTGTFTAIFTAIMVLAGLLPEDYMIESTASTATFNFKPEDNLLSGIMAALSICDWYMDDLPNGTIVIGSASYIRANAASTGIYSFSRGSEVFTHSITRQMDGVYSRICVQRNGPNPKYVYLPVNYYDGWHLTAHRTFYQTAPDTTTDAQMNTIAAQLADGMQYMGIIETFDSPIRPWLQVGDVARITDLGPRYAGILSEIYHRFGKGGFYTSLTATSGGEVTDPEGENPASNFVGKMGGSNRKRRLLDYLIGGITNAGASAVGAVTYQAAASGGYEGTEQQMNENLALVADGAIIPAGGNAGQVLAKATDNDYETEWKDVNDVSDIWGEL